MTRRITALTAVLMLVLQLAFPVWASETSPPEEPETTIETVSGEMQPEGETPSETEETQAEEPAVSEQILISEDIELLGEFSKNAVFSYTEKDGRYELSVSGELPESFTVRLRSNADIIITSDGEEIETKQENGVYEFTLKTLTFETEVINKAAEEETEEAEPAGEEAAEEETEAPVSLPRKSAVRTGTEAETYNIVVNYIFGDNSIAHDPYVAVVQAGEDFDETVTFPVLPGYEAYYNDQPALSARLTYEDIQQNQTAYVTYRPVQVAYQVRHYWQNADNDGYTLHETDYLQGYTGDTAEATPKAYEGFAVLSYDEPEIAADGSTIVEIRYDREYALMRFDLQGGYGVDPIYAKWGSTVPQIQDPARNGYTFAGWDKTIPATVPYGGDVYTASWTATGSSYTVIYWKENADDDGYSFWGSESRHANTGSTVSASDTIPASIAGSEGEHFTFNSTLSDSDVVINGDGTSVINVYYDRKIYTITLIKQSGSDYICGFEEHTHTYDSSVTIYYGGCYPEEGGTEPTCGNTSSHTHTRTCYPNTSTGNVTSTSTGKYNGVLYWDYLTANYGQVNGMIGKRYASDRYKYVYVNGTWWRYSGTASVGSVIQPTCGEEQHIHSYDYSQTLYYGGCYPEEGGTEPVCGLEEHTHTSSCRGTLIHRITAKYGADISGEWTFTGEDGVSYPTTSPISSWKPQQSTIYTERLYDIQTMPGEHSIFYLYTSTNAQRTYYYYVEALPGTTPERTVDGTGYVLHYTLNHDFNYWTRAEDFYEYDGFTQKYAKNSSGTTITGSRYPSSGSLASGEELYMYYTRDTYSITYQSNGEALTVDADGESLATSDYTSVPYQKSLASYDIEPAYPDSFPVGAYTFGGWYDNADFSGSAFDFANGAMPSSNLILFAKWVPSSYDIEIYQDLTKANEGTSPLETRQASYGSVLEAPEEPTPEHEEYVFVGWFHFDEATETELPWVFGSSQVTGRTKIYAKWSSSSIRPYNVYYRDADGNDLAPSVHSSGYAGSTRTFQASPNVPAGYFPRVKSHSILIDIDGTDSNGLNDFTFIYDYSENVPYTVRYLDARTNERLAADKVVDPNQAVRVTEKFKAIPEYVPDAFQKHLTVSIGSENVITFYYTKDSVHAFYLTNHYIEQTDGTWSLYNSLETWSNIGESVTAASMTIPGYYLDTSVSGTVTAGTVTAEGLELKLYYLRNRYPYTVKYIDSRTGLALKEEKHSTGKIDAVVTEEAADITGYDCINGPTQDIIIQMEDDPNTAVRNIITFRYQVQQAKYEYYAVGNGTVSPESEYVAAYAGTAQGSAATPDAGYRLEGWYLDEACTEPVGTEASVSGSRLTPNKTGDRYYGRKFYAKFAKDSIEVSFTKAGFNGETGLVASFSLYKTGSGDQLTYNGSTVNAALTGTVTTPGTASLDCGQSYLLEETDCPPYYRLWDGMVKITVAEDGTITAEDDMQGTYVSVSGLSVTLYDEEMPVIPSGFEQNKLIYLLLAVLAVTIIALAATKEGDTEL